MKLDQIAARVVAGWAVSWSVICGGACSSSSPSPIASAGGAGSIGVVNEGAGRGGSGARAGANAQAGKPSGGMNAQGGDGDTSSGGRNSEGGDGGANRADGGEGGDVAAGGAAAGAGGTGPLGGSGGGGTFVPCDDPADFDGRARCPEASNVGAVFAFEYLTANEALTQLTAKFGSTVWPLEQACTREAVASCELLTCPHFSSAGPTGPAAGDITVKSSGGTLVTSPFSDDNYLTAELPAPLWSPLATLSFTAAGGQTPAFEGSFCGPSGVTITTPAGALGAGLVIDRSSDLHATWSNSSVGDVELIFRELSANLSADITLQCFFPTAAGQGTVPKAALAKISAGLHQVASYTWVRKLANGGGGTCTELTAIITNVASTGAVPFNGDATFQ